MLSSMGNEGLNAVLLHTFSNGNLSVQNPVAHFYKDGSDVVIITYTDFEENKDIVSDEFGNLSISSGDAAGALYMDILGWVESQFSDVSFTTDGSSPIPIADVTVGFKIP